MHLVCLWHSTYRTSTLAFLILLCKKCNICNFIKIEYLCIDNDCAFIYFYCIISFPFCLFKLLHRVKVDCLMCAVRVHSPDWGQWDGTSGVGSHLVTKAGTSGINAAILVLCKSTVLFAMCY